MYQIGNLEFEKGDYAAAKADYKALQKLNPRSQELSSDWRVWPIKEAT